MIRSIYTINRNMNILRKKQENTSGNIANLNTPGYKFQDIVQSTLESKEMINYAGGNDINQRQELGSFTFGNRIDGIYRNFEQGSLYETNNSTDFAIVGNGFFTIRINDNDIGFTRNGNFKVNEENQLVTMEGNRVLGLDSNGDLTYIYVGNNNTSFLIADFDDYSNLNNIGETLFTNDELQYNTIEGEIKEGYLEMSNVKVTDELVKMIQISREFESNQKLLHSADETLNKAVNEIGRL